jgi:microcystin degradation protein MlrC
MAMIAVRVERRHNCRSHGGAGVRLLIAMMKHETNTFSPVPTPLARFAPLYGEAAIRAFRGTGTGLGAYLDLAERERADIVLPIAAGAPPSRPVDDDAYAHITDTICEAVARGGFDGIMFDLHGAMVTESLEDGEGQFLKRLRAIDPKTPIAVSLDMHANLYDEIIANATVVTGYRTYPHIDTYETARLAGEILLRTIRGEVNPVMAWGNVPMLPHVMRQGTDDHPNKELQHRCAAMSGDGALAASLFTGFPHADIANAGLSAVVVTDGNLKLAEDLRDELLDRAWVEREAFVYDIEPLQQSFARAKALPPPEPGEGPIALLDHYDNCASGGTMDATVVLAEILRQGLENVAAFAIYDPEAVQQAIAAGVGAEVSLSIGGKVAMPAIPADSRNRHGQDDLERPLPQPRPDGSRRADGYGPNCGARHRPGRDRADLAPCRALRPQLPRERRHRPHAETLCHAEKPHPLAGWARQARESRRRVRRRRCLHF